MKNQSYVVAAVGKSHAVLAQCFAKTPEKACAAVGYFAMDLYGEEFACQAIDKDGMPGMWIEGSPEYINAVCNGATTQ